jgi:hypothetical protein
MTRLIAGVLFVLAVSALSVTTSSAFSTAFGIDNTMIFQKMLFGNGSGGGDDAAKKKGTGGKHSAGLFRSIS